MGTGLYWHDLTCAKHLPVDAPESLLPRYALLHLCTQTLQMYPFPLKSYSPIRFPVGLLLGPIRYIPSSDGAGRGKDILPSLAGTWCMWFGLPSHPNSSLLQPRSTTKRQ